MTSCHLYTPFWKTSRLKDPMLALRDPAIRLILWNLLVCQKQKRSLAEGVMAEVTADWDVLELSF